jgi:Phosphotransferase enzyme family
VPCRYVGRRRLDALETGYIIMSFVTDGKMLSDSWERLRCDITRRSNLFRGLAQIILSLNQSPLPRIGSLTLDNQGILTLTNRPLTLRLQSLENEGIPTKIGRNVTYSAMDTYLFDLLGCHDNRIYYQPNSIHDIDDGQQQMAALTMMRAVLHHFARHEHRHGPFVFTLTDLHQSNIYVDDEWHITCLIDLEWACSLPIELQCPPYWLSGRAVDDIEHGEPLETFSQMIDEFLEAFATEEKKMVGQTLYQTRIMRSCWESGAFWYFQAVNSPKGLYRIFNHHIQRLFCLEHCRKRVFDQVLAPYWGVGAQEIIEKKIKDEQEYKDRLKEMFATKSE